MQKSVGTGCRHQVQSFVIVRRQNHTPRIDPAAVVIIAAAAGLGIQVTTSDIGVVQFARLIVLEFDHTATPAAVAKILPLLMTQRC